MARVAFLTLLVSALAAAVVAAAGAAQDDPAMSLPSLPTFPGTPSAMLPRNLTCTSMLLGCMVYYQNTTSAEAREPLDMCCAPAKKVMDGDMYCLCDGLNNQALVAAMGLDVKKGLTMFSNCGVKLPDSVCSDPGTYDTSM
jgi:hypothetical protein